MRRAVHADRPDGHRFRVCDICDAEARNVTRRWSAEFPISYPKERMFLMNRKQLSIAQIAKRTQVKAEIPT